MFVNKFRIAGGIRSKEKFSQNLLFFGIGKRIGHFHEQTRSNQSLSLFV